MYRVACRYALTRFLNVISQAETSLKAPKSARKRHELFPGFDETKPTPISALYRKDGMTRHRSCAMRSPYHAVCQTEGPTPGLGSETCGRPGGKVKRPCHSAFTGGRGFTKLFPTRSQRRRIRCGGCRFSAATKAAHWWQK